ncbi:UvrD-helicase domain-containing protein [Aliidiomarina indica]|uniref:UvrD-helicase domain-containing protein n=1 Tax=Aliidiomarina indica TaxID=2749147 RepID=UPI00188F0FDA|nr:UvrD-helicase domain-containing protein [Aliidiomarina indica]
MNNVTVAISQDFFMAFAKLPKSKQRKVNEFVHKFRADPMSPGINYEKINDAASDNYRSVRIDQDYRGIVLKPEQGNVYLVMWVDKHDDAYDWARKHKCTVNRQTGSLQIYEVIEAGEVHVPAKRAELEKTQVSLEPLFDIAAEDLLRLGIPDDRIEQVQALTQVAELEAITAKLPVEAYEALALIADGLSFDEVVREYAVPESAPSVDTADVEAALERAQTQRRFKVLSDDEELTQMLDAPLERWRVFLHPSQRALVERDWNGPVRVLGGAGTGKTVVAMHRAKWLIKNRLAQGERILFTTYTANLALDIEAHLRKICSADEMRRIEVTNIDKWLIRFLKRENQPCRIVYPGNDAYDKCWQQALTLMPTDVDLPESFYDEEFFHVVLPQQVKTEQEYFRAKRIGRGTSLTRPIRSKIWPVFEEMRFQLHKSGLLTNSDAVFSAINLLNEGASIRPFKFAVVDETQDLGSEVLQLIRALVDEAENDLFLVGDGHQRIYKRKASLGKCGIRIIGRGRKLRINYRTTDEIRRFATSVLENVDVDDLDEGTDPVKGYRSLIAGNPPVIEGFESAEAEAEWIKNEVQALIDDGVSSRDICIVGRTEKALNIIVMALRNVGIAVNKVSRDVSDNLSLGGIRTATMHRVKGLEFKFIFIIGVNDGAVPFDMPWASSDPVEMRNHDLNERALFHVAGTRAIHGLYVSYYGEPSRFLLSGV